MLNQQENILPEDKMKIGIRVKSKSTLAAAISAAKDADVIYVFPNIRTWEIEGDNNMRISHTMLEHTRMRFNTMSNIQLWTRMGKTTNPEKLEAFAAVAEERGHMDLAIAARARLASITGKLSINTNSEKEFSNISSKLKQKKIQSRCPQERLLRKIDK